MQLSRLRTKAGKVGGKRLLETSQEKTKEPRQGLFFQLRKLLKGLVVRLENLKPALCV
jgi:hypothetical protein